MLRRTNSIRGTLTGYIKGFDKHLNLLLVEVTEIYSLAKHGNGPLSATGSQGLHDRHVSESNRSARKGIQKLDRRQLGRRVRKRYLPQVLVRGDNIVMIWKADSVDDRSNAR